MPTYVFDQGTGAMVDKATGEPMLGPQERDKPLQVPLMYPDAVGYQSPIDGRWIEGNRARRYDLESNNCIEGGDIKRKSVLKNEKFAKKRGLEHLLEK